ncbi:MAG: response regulator transcription factor [Oscillospiraceae bacterium]|nr:response regulator transcription factor [Oscillospiraceae bacterium]
MNTNSGYLLLVEDEPAVQLNNKKILQRRGYNVKQAFTLAEARALIEDEHPKCIILDLQLPDGHGLQFLEELRSTTNIPVLILTALGTTNDIIRGFETGGDDYLTKPYDLSVFLLRVETLLRSAAFIPETLEYEKIKLYPTAGRVVVDGVDVVLSQKEYSILQLFVQRPDKIMTAEYVYEKVWGQQMLENDNSLKVAMSKLRTKLADVGYAVTASRGEGYYLERLK